jgi:hypothetical protein
MRGLDPRIHQRFGKSLSKGMDCRVKPGNDHASCFSHDNMRLNFCRHLTHPVSSRDFSRGAVGCGL